MGNIIVDLLLSIPFGIIIRILVVVAIAAVIKVKIPSFHWIIGVAALIQYGVFQQDAYDTLFAIGFFLPELVKAPFFAKEKKNIKSNKRVTT